jgi:hypothetical protein
LANPKFHILLFIPLLVLIKRYYLIENKYIIISLIIAFSIPIKNYIFFNSFGYTFWLKANISSNYNITEDPWLIKTSKNNKTLTEPIIYIDSKKNLYNSKEFKSHVSKIDLINSFKFKVNADGYFFIPKKIIHNILILFKSPINYGLYFRQSEWRIDLLSPVCVSHHSGHFNLHFNKVNFIDNVGISIYSLFYPLLLIIVFFRMKIDHFTLFIILMILYFIGITSIIDGGESQRMRFAIEPLFYYLIFVCRNNYSTYPNISET